jgi:predicted negative regulator of RcsB-dependent stress response
MKRLTTALLLGGLLGLAAGSPARAQDEVRYLDRATKKEATAKGTIQSESPSQIVVKQTPGGAKEIPAVDVLDVIYQTSALVRFDYRGAHNSETSAYTAPTAEERKKSLASALTKYKELLPKVTEEKPKRHIEFVLAKLQARQAEDDASERDAAIDKLAKFKKDYPDSWQITACSKLLAALQMEKKDFAAAQKTFEELAAIPNLSKEVRQEADLMTAQVLIGGKNYAEAEKKLQELMKAVPPDDPQAVRIQVSLAECLAATGKIDQAVPQVQAVIAKTADNDLKALAYNTLGDCYRLANKPEDALWAYLWVDVVYHQNRQEHAKALYHLYKLFKERQDEAKAKQCKDRLEKDKQFAGLEYQRLVEAEK